MYNFIQLITRMRDKVTYSQASILCSWILCFIDVYTFLYGPSQMSVWTFNFNRFLHFCSATFSPKFVLHFSSPDNKNVPASMFHSSIPRTFFIRGNGIPSLSAVGNGCVHPMHWNRFWSTKCPHLSSNHSRLFPIHHQNSLAKASGHI
jgi:hypothetical protein